jgi:hypothetical protein
MLRFNSRAMRRPQLSQQHLINNTHCVKSASKMTSPSDVVVAMTSVILVASLSASVIAAASLRLADRAHA